MPFSFPASPSIGDQSTQNGRVYQWTGFAWEIAAASAAIDGAAITSGTIATARLGSGTADSTTFLRGDGAWASPSGGSHASTHQTGGADPIQNVVVTVSQITANQNDWSIGTGDIFRVSADAARTVTGMAGGSGGMVRMLVNVGTGAITLSHESASSAAANRFTVPWASNYTLDGNGGAALLFYDGTTSRWRVV